MTDEIMDYQEEMAEEALEDSGPEQTFATIGAVYSDGVSLLFDGEDEPSAKHYKVNTFFKYSVGQRVYIAKDSGTYVVLCAIGRPATSIAADTATNATEAGTADRAVNVGDIADYSGTVYAGSGHFGGTSAHMYIDGDEIYPNGSSTYTPSGTLGTSMRPFKDAYIRNSLNHGGATGATVGFYGAAPITRQTLSTTSQNQGYTSATSSNYLTILNNICGIHKKLGLINT